MEQHILLRHRDIENIHRLEVYRQHGGFEAFRKAVTTMTPDEVIEVVKASNLRGRGGAGFPTGVKWSFIPKHEPIKYVVVNADESEPGTFKDREILEKNPHQLIEGALIAAYAIQAKAIYVYCRGEFWDLAHELDQHIAAVREAGFLGQNILGSSWSCEMYTHLGAGAYICGEESALLNSLQGLLGQPRVRPPFPAQKGGGLYYEATVVNNVETLTNVPWIIMHGADAYKQMGTPESPGPKIYCLSGHVARPGNYELPLGITFRELIFEHAGGIPDDRRLKAILPSGASGPVLPATDEVLDTPLTYEAVAQIGSTLGSASIILLDETVNMAWAAAKMMEFFSHESCGKCTPCREGTYWSKMRYRALLGGRVQSEKDIDILADVAGQMAGITLCALGEFAVNPVVATIKHFREDYLAWIKQAEEKQAARPPAREKAPA
ncbi:MAG: NADH-quinone oxidoreductase subunit NuoF [Anaerolineae bacterium]|nr:NADH-quinone oxidoreductase subunit NuoF [Anaerolineae bacterium]